MQNFLGWHWWSAAAMATLTTALVIVAAPAGGALWPVIAGAVAALLAGYAFGLRATSAQNEREQAGNAGAANWSPAAWTTPR